MRYRFVCRFRTPTDEQKQKAEMIWKATDITFKFFQWSFFNAVILAAASKSKSLVLTVIGLVLFFLLWKVFADNLTKYVEIGVLGHPENWLYHSLRVALIAIMSAVTTAALTYVMLDIIGAMAIFQLMK